MSLALGRLARSHVAALSWGLYRSDADSVRGATCSIKDSHGRERRLWLVATTPLRQHGRIVARGRAHALEVLAIDRS